MEEGEVVVLSSEGHNGNEVEIDVIAKNTDEETGGYLH